MPYLGKEAPTSFFGQLRWAAARRRGNRQFSKGSSAANPKFASYRGGRGSRRGRTTRQDGRMTALPVVCVSNSR